MLNVLEVSISCGDCAFQVGEYRDEGRLPDQPLHRESSARRREKVRPEDLRSGHVLQVAELLFDFVVIVQGFGAFYNCVCLLIRSTLVDDSRNDPVVTSCQVDPCTPRACHGQWPPHSCY